LGRIAWEVANIAGSIVAAAYGGPFAGAAAYAAGEAVANFLLFPPSSEAFGPRLGDLATPQGSVIRSFRPIGWGRCRIPGKMIWQLGNQLQERISRQGSGIKGGEGQTTYSYSTTAAFLFGQGPAVSITRLWGDGKLFYSWDGVNPATAKEKYPGVVRVYLGEETQEPDPTIQAGRATISGYAMTAGGTGYVVGDTGGIGGGNDDLGYKVLTIGGGGAVLSVQLFGGTGYVIGPSYPLHRGGVQEGHGTNASLHITSIASGTTQVPAWRDSVYVLLNNMPLADFGNHLLLPTAEVNFTASPIPIATILHSLCLSAGLEEGQIDVSRVEQTVEGYVLLNRPSARAAIQPLLDVFLIDCVETDDQIIFVPRGQAPLFTIPQACLGAHEAQEPVPPPLSLTHMQEIEIPARVELSYMDRERDYDWNMQPGERVARPVPTQFSRRVRQIQAPIVMSPDAAKQQALKLLYNSWIGRDQGAFASSRALARLNPTDVVNIQTDALHTLRLTQNDYGAQGLLRWQGVSEQASVFTNTTQGLSSPSTTHFIATPEPTTLLVLDTSIVSAADDDTGLYFAVASEDVRWRGAAVLRSVDGVSDWQPVATFQAIARHGVAATVLEDWPGYNTWDRAHTVDITMTAGVPESFTEAAVLAGLARAALLGNEILYWQNATQLDDVTWRLDTLLRARRGTDWATGDHEEGEAFIILDSETIKRYAAPPSDLNQTRYYKTVSSGESIDDVSAVAVVNQGRGQICFSPSHLRGTRNSSNDIAVTWRPRTRIPWTRIAGIAGPLGEREERYVVSSILGLGSPIVLRSWNLTSRTVTYTAAEQTEDGLVPGDPVYLRVQQGNDYTGAGHPTEAAL
jgi:hypothetical protein